MDVAQLVSMMQGHAAVRAAHGGAGAGAAGLGDWAGSRRGGDRRGVYVDRYVLFLWPAWWPPPAGPFFWPAPRCFAGRWRPGCGAPVGRRPASARTSGLWRHESVAAGRRRVPPARPRTSITSPPHGLLNLVLVPMPPIQVFGMAGAGGHGRWCSWPCSFSCRQFLVQLGPAALAHRHVDHGAHGAHRVTHGRLSACVARELMVGAMAALVLACAPLVGAGEGGDGRARVLQPDAPGQPAHRHRSRPSWPA